MRHPRSSPTATSLLALLAVTPLACTDGTGGGDGGAGATASSVASGATASVVVSVSVAAATGSGGSTASTATSSAAEATSSGASGGDGGSSGSGGSGGASGDPGAGGNGGTSGLGGAGDGGGGGGDDVSASSTASSSTASSGASSSASSTSSTGGGEECIAPPVEAPASTWGSGTDGTPVQGMCAEIGAPGMWDNGYVKPFTVTTPMIATVVMPYQSGNFGEDRLGVFPGCGPGYLGDEEPIIELWRCGTAGAILQPGTYEFVTCGGYHTYSAQVEAIPPPPAHASCDVAVPNGTDLGVERFLDGGPRYYTLTNDAGYTRNAYVELYRNTWVGRATVSFKPSCAAAPISTQVVDQCNFDRRAEITMPANTTYIVELSDIGLGSEWAVSRNFLP